jgi:hypothetical protein
MDSAPKAEVGQDGILRPIGNRPELLPAGQETGYQPAAGFHPAPLRTPNRCPLMMCLLAVSASAQVMCTLGPGASSYKASADQRPSSDAALLAGRVNTAAKTVCGSNCPGVSLFRNTTAANAMLIAEGSQAKLVYAPQFFASANDAFGDAGILALIAHELGHALDDTLGAAWIKSTWTPELRADSWAGCVLAKINLSSKDIESALGALAKYPSPAHPSWSIRLPVLRTGYTSCGGDGTKFSSTPARKP